MKTDTPPIPVPEGYRQITEQIDIVPEKAITTTSQEDAWYPSVFIGLVPGVIDYYAVPAEKQSNPVQDMALGGQITWRDLTIQIAQAWWECHEIGASLQHGDLDTETTFSVVCEQHGGQCFHASTPLDAWHKAKKWLMSPERPRQQPEIDLNFLRP